MIPPQIFAKIVKKFKVVDHLYAYSPAQSEKRNEK